MNESEEQEQNLTSPPPVTGTKLTLEKPVELGEYDPSFLANFPECHSLSRHIQFQYIRRALDNRHRQLMTQYAELNNVLDLRNKPNIWKAMHNVEEQLRFMLTEKERLYEEYSSG